MNQMYQVLIDLLIEKSNITLGEVRNLKYSIKYIDNKNNNLKDRKNSKNYVKSNQFLVDCKILIESLECLETKIRQNIIDMKKVRKKLNQSIKATNEHLTNMLLLDCFQDREFSFSQKLEYLHRSYENLISPYQTLYLPLPTSYRRIRTSNLMLYFNNTLNEKLQILKEKFFNIYQNNEDYKTFTTWNFSEYDHVKNIDESNNILLSLSFWFYEKQLFYPIAFHEIAHPLYYDTKNIHIKLNENDKIFIKSYIDDNIKNSSYSRNQILIQNIYQDIIADFSAFSLSGDSYIFTLFFHGFVQGLYKNFYQDLEIKNLGQKIKDEDRRCLKREKELTLLDWSFQEKGQNFMSYFIRLKLLITLSKKISINNKTYTIFKNKINQIEEILDYIYPTKKTNLNSFENILQSYHKENRQYKYWKNYTLLLTNIFEEIVFNRKNIHNIVSKVLHNTKIDFHQNEIYKDFLISNGIIKSSILNDINSSYDLYWQIALDPKIYPKNLGRLLRLFNLSKLNILSRNNLDKISINNIIYELVYYKLSSKKNPFILFNERDRKNNIIKRRNLKYAFGPYDFVELKKVTTLKKDIELERDFQLESKEQIFFFTERHALLQLDKKDGVTKKNNIFDICISIDIQNELTPNITKKFYTDITKFINDINQDSYQLIQLFVSLGNENFLLYIKNISILDIISIVNKISSIKCIKNLYSIFLLNNNYDINNKHNDIKIDSYKEIIVLGKLKLISEYQTVKAIISTYSSLKIYRKYGVFDFIIIYKPHKTNSYTCTNPGILHYLYSALKKIDEYVSDIQLEYQSS